MAAICLGGDELTSKINATDLEMQRTDILKFCYSNSYNLVLFASSPRFVESIISLHFYVRTFIS